MKAIRLLSAIAILFTAHAATAAVAGDLNAPCRIPFEVLKDTKTHQPFPMESVNNTLNGLPENVRQRYIVADLNTADENGMCRGVEEYWSPASELSEFATLKQLANLTGQVVESLNRGNIESLVTTNPQARALYDSKRMEIQTELADLENFQTQVARYAKNSTPINKERVHNGYCVGQSINYCEIVNGQPKLVYRFITSTSRSVPPPSWYYAPINFINTRHWSSDRKYTGPDADRDKRMGGGDRIALPFANGGHPIEMPNFMNFLPMPGYPGETQNGIHQIAGGLDSGGTFGAPVSLGCVRLNPYQAKLSRWWTPMHAKFYIYFEPHRYLQKGDEATGKARGFRAPRS